MPVIRKHPIVGLWALFAVLALAPAAVAKNDTNADAKPAAKADTKSADTKSPAKHDSKAESKTSKKTSETKTSDKKAEKKTSEQPDKKTSDKKTADKKTSEKPSDKPAKQAHDKPSPDQKTKTTAAHGGGPKSPGRSISAPLPLAPAAHAAAGPAMIAYAPPATAGVPLASATTAATPRADVDAVKQAIGRVRAGRNGEASAIERDISDPLARKLVEWVILRNDDNAADFARYNDFIAANPGWPSMVTFRRRAEAMLWQERAGSATVRGYFANARPLSAKGRFALARAHLTDGDRAGAQALVREAWRNDSFSQELEAQALDLFGELITRADDKARMDRALYTKDDLDAGLRAAKRLGGDQPAIAKARISVLQNASNAKAQLDAVPAAARRDAGYIFAHAQWLRRHDRIAEAGALMQTAPRDPDQLQNVDEWWIERRLVARKLLDIGDAKTPYAVRRAAPPPSKSNYHPEHEFTPGWIRLRFLPHPCPFYTSPSPRAKRQPRMPSSA